MTGPLVLSLFAVIISSLVLLAATIGFFSGWLVVPRHPLGPTDRFDIYNNLLLVVLAILGVIFAVLLGVGAWAYHVLRHAIEDQVRNQVRSQVDQHVRNSTNDIRHEQDRDNLELIETNIQMSYENWRLWRGFAPSQRESRIEWLELAIEVVRGVMGTIDELRRRPGITTQTQSELERQGNLARNNLAYFLADWPLEIGPDGETREHRIAEAHALVDGWYQARRATVELEQDVPGIETCAWVLRRLPRTAADVAESLRIMRILVTRRDILDATRAAWLRQYELA